MDVHLRELRYFVAVAEELHFTRAAERLYMSQPALSKQIRRLEQQLGFALLVRTPRSVRLSAEGVALLPAARALVADWDRAWPTARRAGSDVRLVIGLQTAVGRDLLRPALEEMRARGWPITLRLVPWDDPSVGLGDGACDVAVLWLPAPGPGLLTRTLAIEDRWVALPARHRLAESQEVTIADLLDEAFIALPASAGGQREFWLALPERDGHPVQVAAEAASAQEVLEAVGSGAGVALISRGNAALYPRPDVVFRPVAGLGPAQLALAWRADDDRDEIGRLVASFPAGL